MKKLRWGPAFWGAVIFAASQGASFAALSRVDPLLKKYRIFVAPQPPTDIALWPTAPPPTVPPGETAAPTVGSLGPMLIYFFAAVVVLGIILLVIPVAALKLVLRVVFALLITWGTFIVLSLWLPTAAVIPLAVAAGALWTFVPRVLVHDLAMVTVMVALGTVAGKLITPWTAMFLLLALAVYDLIAVRLGYMLWMAKKMSQTVTLPAFVIPDRLSQWMDSLKEKPATNLVDEDPVERKYSILGGGDIGFPLLLAASVFFGYGLGQAFLVAGFCLFGLMAAYWIQSAIAKGKAVPALPPIAVSALIALVIIRFWW
jgi:presenilin-like A22 family membrane protease